MELKYATRTATNAELEAQAEEGRQQLLRYSKDKVVQKLATGTTLHLLLIQFQGWDMVKCEEINASADLENNFLHINSIQAPKSRIIRANARTFI